MRYGQSVFLLVSGEVINRDQITRIKKHNSTFGTSSTVILADGSSVVVDGTPEEAARSLGLAVVPVGS